jgi:rare lipoprotein A (peptidoglycan hydrolase)
MTILARVSGLMILGMVLSVIIAAFSSGHHVEPVHHRPNRHHLRHRLRRRFRAIIGIASWYSRESSGTITASGEPMRDDLMTCAMRSIPFNTIVEVINLANGRRVSCRINDVGPFVYGRIIDTSPAVCKALDFCQHGLAKVKVLIPQEA